MSWSWIVGGVVIFVAVLAIGNSVSRKKFRKKGRETPDDIYPMF